MKFVSEAGKDQPAVKANKRKKFKNRLPDRIIVVENGDKKYHEKDYPGRNLANFVKPFRCINAGGVNSGKSLVTINLVLRADPPFDDIYVVHASKTSKDYEALDIPEENYLDEIPPPSFFPKEGDPRQTLIIIDDVEFASEGKNTNLSLLCRNVSTHRNVSLIINQQDIIKVPRIARRLMSHCNIWRMPDRSHMSIIESKCGLDKGELKAMFDQLCDSPRDFFTFDLATGARFPVRKNLWTPVKRVDDYEV